MAGRLLLAGLIGVWSAAVAAAVPPAMMQNLHWRSIGPFRGGRVLAVAGAPEDRERFYFGAVNGGVWRTDDAGRTWAPIFDATPVGSIGALAVAPSAPAVIYVGTGEADMRSDIAQGAGVFRSGDGGGHWAPIGLEDTQQIGRILVDPRDPNVVLVAALGHPYGPNAQRGVFRSGDGGRSWTKTLFRDADTGAIDMAFQPGHPEVVYAALWQTRRPPWSVYPPSSGAGSGLYKSGDGGRSWTQLQEHGLPAAVGRIGIAVSAARPDRVFALVDTRESEAGEAGLYRSDDAGAKWVRVSDDKRIRERAWYFSGITADPANADVVYVCDTIVLRSDDGGAHFLPIKGDPTGDDFHSLWIDPADPARRILGSDQGAQVSVNGGRTWSSWYNQPTGQFYHVSTDHAFPYRVYGAQQDSGAADVASRSDSPSDGITMGEFHESAAGGEADNIAPDPDHPDVVYGGRVDRLDLRSGQLRNVDPTLAFPDNYRATWTLPLVFGPLDHALYFGNQRIFRTPDGGAHWTAVSPDLTRPDPGVPATLDAATAADVPGPGPRRGVVYAISPSPITADLVWAGTDDGLVWRTQDGGAHWSDATPAGLSVWSKIGVVEASHFDVDVAYLAVDRHRLDDATPYVYRTADSGRSWIRLTEGFPTGSVNVVREDPVERNLLYAGTEHGVFVSFDAGGHWQDLRRDLPHTSVRDIVVHGNDLVIATHGRGFYIMDDITQLRALASDASAAPRLFAPAPAFRVHPPAFTGTPMPRDEPMAANPPSGAIFNYVLPEGFAGSVEIAVANGNGQVVRRYRNTDARLLVDLTKLAVAPEWAVPPEAPAASPGAHRFIWDLHYEKPEGLTGGDPEPQGVWAPPGEYAVMLNAGGQISWQGLRVLPDPRLKLGVRDLDQQFALARRIEAARVTCRTALAQSVKLRERLAGNEVLRAKLDALTDVPPDDARDAGRGPPKRVDGLADISERLDRLAQAVDGADAAPTDDAVAGAGAARQALDKALVAWGEVVKASSSK